jgi:hypothetical protein
MGILSQERASCNSSVLSRHSVPLPHSLAALLLFAFALQAAPGEQPKSVFDMPAQQGAYMQASRALTQLFAAKRYAQAEAICQQLTQRFPDNAGAYYNLACARAMQGKTEPALKVLAIAVDKGFRDVAKIETDSDLASLRKTTRYTSILKAANQPIDAAAKPDREMLAAAPENGVATIAETNTGWNARLFAFYTAFKVPSEKPGTEAPVLGDLKGQVAACEKVRGWYKAGTAAGNHGDFYHNNDRDHSNMHFKAFKQLTRIEYGKESRGAHDRYTTGLAEWFVFNVPTIGNSSTAHTKGPFWRSQPRFAMTDRRRIMLQATHYLSNQLYFYPEHKDYDDDKGDVYPANTPYVVISQGSSGSDKAFMNAFMLSMAALRPTTKKRLVEKGALMPTLQQTFRRCYALSKGADVNMHYLSGVAHPVVFDGGKIGWDQMIEAAHALKPDELPPIALIEAKDLPPPADAPPVMSPHPEQLFNTPAAVARVYRRLTPSYTIALSAAKSKDINDRKLTYKWVVLRGDADAITIKPTNKTGSHVQVTVPWFEAFPVAAGGKKLTNRLDIGLFAYNGKHYSAPAFFTLHRLANEERVYKKGRLESVDYQGKAYVDPVLSVKKDWKDTFRYKPDGTLGGWTRARQAGTQSFTANGELLKGGKPVKVRYMPERGKDGVMSIRQVEAR